MRAANALSKRQGTQGKTADNSKKYVVGPDPLEQEKELDHIRAPNAFTRKRMLEVVNALTKDPRLQPEEIKALDIWKTNLAADKIESTVHQEFLRDFWGWMIGRGKEEDHLKTPWYRQSLADDPEVAAYVDMFVRKLHDFKLKLQLLTVRRPLGINQVFLYYKYIICGESASSTNFLEDWKLFEEEFHVARKTHGQDWADPKDFHPHETAPYGDVRKAKAQERYADFTKKEADRTLGKDFFSGGPVWQRNEGWPETDSTSEDDDPDEPSSSGGDDGPGAPSPQEAPVMPVPLASDIAGETDNPFIQAKRAQERVVELEEEERALAARIETIKKKYQQLETEEEEESKAARDARAAEREHLEALTAEAKVRTEALAEFKGMAESLNRYQEQMLSEVQSFHAAALQGQKQAQSRFLNQASRATNQLFEQLQKGAVREFPEFEKQIGQLREGLNSLREKNVETLDQLERQKVAQAGLRAEIAEKVAAQARENGNNIQAGIRKVMEMQQEQQRAFMASAKEKVPKEKEEEEPERVVEMEIEQPMIEEMAEAPETVAAPLQSNQLRVQLEHIDPDIADQVVESFGRTELFEVQMTEMQEEVVSQVQVLDPVVKAIPAFKPVFKAARKATEKLSRVQQRRARQQHKVQNEVLRAEEAARNEVQNDAILELAQEQLPQPELREVRDRAEMARDERSQKERAVRVENRRLEREQDQEQEAVKEVAKSIKQAKTDSNRAFEAGQEHLRVQEKELELQHEAHNEAVSAQTLAKAKMSSSKQQADENARRMAEEQQRYEAARIAHEEKEAEFQAAEMQADALRVAMEGYQHAAAQAREKYEQGKLESIAEQAGMAEAEKMHEMEMAEEQVAQMEVAEAETAAKATEKMEEDDTTAMMEMEKEAEKLAMEEAQMEAQAEQFLHAKEQYEQALQKVREANIARQRLAEEEQRKKLELEKFRKRSEHFRNRARQAVRNWQRSRQSAVEAQPEEDLIEGKKRLTADQKALAEGKEYLARTGGTKERGRPTYERSQAPAKRGRETDVSLMKAPRIASAVGGFRNVMARLPSTFQRLVGVESLGRQVETRAEVAAEVEQLKEQEKEELEAMGKKTKLQEELPEPDEDEAEKYAEMEMEIEEGAEDELPIIAETLKMMEHLVGVSLKLDDLNFGNEVETRARLLEAVKKLRATRNVGEMELETEDENVPLMERVVF